MRKQSRRKNREEQKASRRAVKKTQKELRNKNNELSGKIIPRTLANNAKCSTQTIAEELDRREDVVSAQIQPWLAILPLIIRQFSKIPDYRNPKKIKHKVTVLMLYGLFSFVFQFTSRREANRELSQPQFYDMLHSIFPEFDSIPHVDTVYRFLKEINPIEIEKISIAHFKKLIKNKKFNNYLINRGYPVSIDGMQKLVRKHFIAEPWLERTTKTVSGPKKQQYVYVVEANLTLSNGLTIPIMSEFLDYDIDNERDKQDCELNGFKKIAARLKKYFPKLKIMIIGDALYPCESVLKILLSYRWDFMIRLPAHKYEHINTILKSNKDNRQPIPGQPRFREREQTFYWENDIDFNISSEIKVHAICCHEKYEEVCEDTAKIKIVHTEHKWISNIPFNIYNVNELCNFGARSRQLIEDSINTEKNRGYQCKKLLSENWNAMRCAHLLMRLAHAINAICEFTRKLKTYIKDNGVRVILKLIRETISNPWLTKQWIENQLKRPARLLL